MSGLYLDNVKFERILNNIGEWNENWEIELDLSLNSIVNVDNYDDAENIEMIYDCEIKKLVKQ